MSDLFDGVKPPKEQPEQPTQEASAQAPKATTEKRSGVPAARLWGWAVPLMAVVLVIVLWSVSVWLAVAVGVAALLGVAAVAIVRVWRGRSGRTSRTVGAGRVSAPRAVGGRAGSRSGGRSGGRTGSRWNPGNWMGSGRRSGRSTGQGRSGRSSAGHRRGRSASGQAVGADGHRTKRGRVRSWLRPGRRGATSGGAAFGGRSRGRGATGRGSSGRGGGTSGRGSRVGSSGRQRSGGRTNGRAESGSRWSRSRANPTTWIGPRRSKAKAARNAEKRRKEKKGDPKGKKESTEKKRRWWLWRKKTKKEPTEEKPTDEKKSEKPTGKDEKPKAKGKKKEKKQDPKSGDDFEFDDGGFPIAPHPNWQSAPKPAPKPLNVDDGGFISPVIPKRPKQSTPTGSNTRRSTMSDRTTNPYVDEIDTSSTETFRASTQAAADELRKNASLKEEEATDLRRQAAALIEKELPNAAESLLSEAARLEEDAGKRRQAAAAYESV